MSKKRISLWKTESKNGNVYLAGTDKEAGVRWFVFKDSKDPNIRNLANKELGSNELTTVATLNVNKKEDTEEVFFTGGDYFVGTNMYYYEDDADAAKGGVRHLTRADGTTVVNKEGEPIEKNSHVLLINVQ